MQHRLRTAAEIFRHDLNQSDEIRSLVRSDLAAIDGEARGIGRARDYDARYAGRSQLGGDFSSEAEAVAENKPRFPALQVLEPNTAVSSRVLGRGPRQEDRLLEQARSTIVVDRYGNDLRKAGALQHGFPRSSAQQRVLLS